MSPNHSSSVITREMLAAVLVLVLLVGVVYLYRRSRSTLPGPWGVPVVGNVFQLEKMLHKPLCRWAKEYGPFFRIRIFTTEILVVNEAGALREIFGEESFSGRMDLTLLTPEGHVHGLLNTEGEENKELRRFTLKTLRDFGFGKSLMEERIMGEVEEFLEGIRKVQGTSVRNVKERVFLAIVNSIWATVAGKRNRQDDPELQAMATKIQEMVEFVFSKGAVFLFVPKLAEMFPGWSGLKRIREETKSGVKFFQDPVDEHKATYSPDHHRDFIDVFLSEMKRASDPTSAFYGGQGDKNLVATLGDLYFGGTDTTASTLTWMILLLAHFPEVQKKLQEEIDAVVGFDRPCALSDRPKMAYMEAVMAETMRFGTVSPQGISHRTMRDAEFRGHKVKKDTLIMPNFFHMNFDENVWGDPEAFRPERFLTPSGLYKRNESFQPFSTGRRACIGETLARDNVFLFGTNLYQRYEVGLDPEGPQNGLEASVSLIRVPLPYSVIMRRRYE